MKVSELIESLKVYDPKMEIVIASDEEGNNFNIFNDIGTAFFNEDIELVDMEDIYEVKAQEFMIFWP